MGIPGNSVVSSVAYARFDSTIVSDKNAVAVCFRGDVQKGPTAKCVIQTGKFGEHARHERIYVVMFETPSALM